MSAHTALHNPVAQPAAPALALLLVCGNAFASDHCATWVAELLAHDHVETLAAHIQHTSPDDVRRLAQWQRDLGELRHITALPAPQPGLSRRWSVPAAPLATDTAAYSGSWASAESAHRGKVQFFAAAKLGASCELLGLHIDTYVPE